MKYILFIIFPVFSFGQSNVPKITQEYHCQFKLNEWAQWQPVDATIIIKDEQITLKEIAGVRLTMDYNQAITDPNGIQFFIYNGAIRMTINANVISILEKHFKCDLIK